MSRGSDTYLKQKWMHGTREVCPGPSLWPTVASRRLFRCATPCAETPSLRKACPLVYRERLSTTAEGVCPTLGGPGDSPEPMDILELCPKTKRSQAPCTAAPKGT